MKELLAAVMIAISAARAATGAHSLAMEERHADADIGFLDVSSDPPAKIFIDESDTGKTTPAQHLPLKAGHHKLTLITTDGAHRRTLGFTVDAGQTTKLSIHLAS